MKTLQKHFKDIVRVTIAIFFALGLLSGALEGVWGFFDYISETWSVHLLLAMFVYATFVKRTTYINPQNGHKEHIDGWSFVLCLIFGCFYFAVKRAWRYFFGILAAVVVFIILTDSGMPGWLAFLPIILPPFFLDMFMTGHYGRIGWMRESSAKEGDRNQEKGEYKIIHIPNIKTLGWVLLAVLAFGFVLLPFGGGDRRLPEGSHLTKVSDDECATECSSICGAFRSDYRPHAVWGTSGDCRRLCLSKAGYPECTINSLRIGVKHVCPDCVISRDRR